MKFRATAAIALALVPLVAGCGGSGGGSSSPGGKVFASAGCGNCHTLEAAGAKGQVGPNLDELKPDASTVARQVRAGGNGMPSFGGKLSRREIAQVAAFVSSSTRGSGTSFAFEPDGTTLSDCEQSGKPFCFRQAFGNLAYRDGPVKALALLAGDDARIAAVHADCHQISHWIGRAGLAYYKHDAGQALSHGAMTCNSGYYHGVLQVALAGLPRDVVVRKARTLCSAPAVNTEEFLLYQCVHGLGHGLMIYSGNDLPWSLRTCHKLRTEFDRVSCTGGVFMQNLDTTMGSSRYLRARDPLYPCTAVAERDKVYCYLMVTSRILALDGYDWRKTAAWCRRSEPAWVKTCFESYGRDASGTSQYQPARTIELCLEAGPNAGDCIYGAARDYGNNYAGGRQATRLCAAAPARYRPRCYEGIGTILGALHRLGPERRAACDAITPKRYRRDCYHGAAVT
ncbi:MAG TPA: cytochrome c [Gaiellaceae bacterium]|nr:cytochrome c [Gaiellaceae bacterium]